MCCPRIQINQDFYAFTCYFEQNSVCNILTPNSHGELSLFISPNIILGVRKSCVALLSISDLVKTKEVGLIDEQALKRSEEPAECEVEQKIQSHKSHNHDTSSWTTLV